MQQGPISGPNRFLAKIAQVSARLMETDRKILLTLAKKLASRVPLKLTVSRLRGAGWRQR